MNEFTNNEILRYSRQLIIPEMGVNGQLNLKNRSALVIGCGGLGCPASFYLCTAGIGTLGVADSDTIDLSNLQRQIAHDELSIGKNKAKNLVEQCKMKNSSINYIIHEVLIEKSNVLEIISKYDVILDCSDNVMTRYLINDSCVLLKKPLVSGSALRFDGQLTVYNYKDGPCFRCVFPTPPPKETISNCSDSGIIGPVVGAIGSLQALEAIKILTNIGDCLNGRLLNFNGCDFQTRIVKLRKKSENCVICNGTLKNIDTFDYLHFCNTKDFNDKSEMLEILDVKDRINSQQLNNKFIKKESLLILDVRSSNEFEICALPGSLNIDISLIKKNTNEVVEQIQLELVKRNTNTIIAVCRRGNDSQIAVELLKKYLENKNIDLKDLIGGLHDWHYSVDKSFPIY